MLATVNVLEDALISNQAPGEKAAVVNSANLKLSVKVESPDQVSQATAPGSKFDGLSSALPSNLTTPVTSQVRGTELGHGDPGKSYTFLISFLFKDRRDVVHCTVEFR